ncbi:MAG TPA: sensor domain-containing diguanylate cyclase [Egibacteraceae bacterium]|nr:sensor domain-containing diguanylate cyclase [Egibacteraceae bacterium]
MQPRDQGSNGLSPDSGDGQSTGTRRLDFEGIAQGLVDVVTVVTDFQVAVVSLRVGAKCRRLAASGLVTPRIGLETEYAHWDQLVRPERRRGSIGYVLPPAAETWTDIADPQPTGSEAGNTELGIMLTLLDPDDQVVGFLSVAEPRSGRLPSTRTVQMLELLGRQVQVALVNGHLYDTARQQAETMAELFKVAKTMAQTFELDTIFGGIAHAALARLDVFNLAVLRFAEGKVHIIHSEGSGKYDSEYPHTEISLEGWEAFYDRLSGEGFFLVADTSEFPSMAAYELPHTRSKLLAAHIESGGATVALSAVSERPNAFDADDIAFLRGLVDTTALAVRNAELYDEVRRAAERDSLTGLKNRGVFWREFPELLAVATPNRPLALAVADVDDFKLVNDRHGHFVGDRALEHIADRLIRNTRETDRIYRIGGEEFTILMPDTPVDAALAVMERVRAAVTRSRESLPPLSISTGLAVAPAQGQAGDDLFRAADVALYRAKHAGKDRVMLATEGDQLQHIDGLRPPA